MRRGLVGMDRAVRRGRGTRGYLAASLLALVTCFLVTSAVPASAVDRPTPPVLDAQPLTPGQLTDQVKAADALRAEVMRSSAQVAAANSRLERLSGQASTLLADLSAARTEQVAAQTEAAQERTRLRRLGVEVQAARDALGQLASDSYTRGGGALGDIVAMLEALTAPSAEKSTDSLATVQYLVGSSAREVDHLRLLRSAQVATSARAETASRRATAAATRAAKAKADLEVVIADQRTALRRFRVAQTDQLGRAAGVLGELLRSEDAAAAEADRQLRAALGGQDSSLLPAERSTCGQGAESQNYPNGHFPASALCPLYAAPNESLTRKASIAFNAMSHAYERQTGSALCVTDGYRPYAEQVAVHLASPRMTATPGKSQHGLGLAVDLCGGVQSFGDPAHLWMQRNAPLYGWFHPAWAEPSGVTPEPWHWEFAH